MITFKEKVEKDINSFELKIKRAKEYADQQAFEESVILHKEIATIEYDLNELKNSLGPHFGPIDDTRDYLEPEVKANYERVIDDFKELDGHITITIWNQEPSIIESLQRQFKSLKEKLIG